MRSGSVGIMATLRPKSSCILSQLWKYGSDLWSHSSGRWRIARLMQPHWAVAAALLVMCGCAHQQTHTHVHVTHLSAGAMWAHTRSELKLTAIILTGLYQFAVHVTAAEIKHDLTALIIIYIHLFAPQREWETREDLALEVNFTMCIKIHCSLQVLN